MMAIKLSIPVRLKTTTAKKNLSGFSEGKFETIMREFVDHNFFDNTGHQKSRLSVKKDGAINERAHLSLVFVGSPPSEPKKPNRCSFQA